MLRVRGVSCTQRGGRLGFPSLSLGTSPTSQNKLTNSKKKTLHLKCKRSLRQVKSKTGNPEVQS